MGIALRYGNNKKQRQTHTNIFETKTTKLKDWLARNTRAPAGTAVIIGLLSLAYSVPALMSSSVHTVPGLNELDVLSTPESIILQQPVTATEQENTSQITENTPETTEPEEDTTADNTGQTRTSIRIEVSTNAQSESEGDSDNHQPTSPSSLTVNGKPVELPNNGRIKEDVEDKYSQTKIRGRIDADNNANIDISTKIRGPQEAD